MVTSFIWEGPFIGFSGTGTAGITLLFMNVDGQVVGELWAGGYVQNPFEDTGLIGVPEEPKNTDRTNFYKLSNNETVEDRVNISRIIKDQET